MVFSETLNCIPIYFKNNDPNITNIINTLLTLSTA
ncbi:hypothetical protein AEQU1_00242 [Aequorivita sp. CIP111184]|nr:hypothetical protein AEQU1_00242 [Aequorivita sp. CIP111184]